MEPSPVKIVACFVIFAVIGTEAMNYMAFPRLGRSPRSAIEKLNGRYNGQAFAFPRGRRALDSDVAVDTSLRTKSSLDRQIFHHFTNQPKTTFFKTKTPSRIKRSLYNKKYASAHRFGYYSKHTTYDNTRNLNPEAQIAKRVRQFPMPRSPVVPSASLIDRNSPLKRQGHQENFDESEEAKQPMHKVSMPKKEELRILAGDFLTRRYPMLQSYINSAEISRKFPISKDGTVKTHQALADNLLIHRRKYAMPWSNVSKRSVQSRSNLDQSFLTDWLDTTQKLNLISKHFLSSRPKEVQRSVFIMPKRSSSSTNTKRADFYPMPRSTKRNGFYPIPRSVKRSDFFPMPRSTKRTGFYPMPRSAKRTGFYPMPRSSKRTDFYPMPRSSKRNNSFPMPRSAKRTGFYPMPRNAKRTGFYPMPRNAKRTGFYPMPRSAKRNGFYPMPRNAKRTAFYPMPRNAKRTGFYPMPRSDKRTGFYPMPRSAKRIVFYPMPRSARRTNLYPLPRNGKPMPRKRTEILPVSREETQNLLSNQYKQMNKRSNVWSSDDLLMSRDTAQSGNYPMPRDTAQSGYYPMPRDVAQPGYYPMPRNTAQAGYYPMPRDTAQSGYYPMPRDTAQSGYYPMPRDTAQSGYYPMPRDTEQSSYQQPRNTQSRRYFPMPRDFGQKVYKTIHKQIVDDLTSNFTENTKKHTNVSKWLTDLDVIALIETLKSDGLERNGEERSLSKVYEWLDDLKKDCSDGFTKCPSLLNGLRGYLAFPRLGRSDGQTIQNSEFEQAECCPEGLKLQWIVIGASKPEIRSRCSPKSVCCEGLEELVGRSSEHIFYTKCVPKTTDEKTENEVLDRLLRKS